MIKKILCVLTALSILFTLAVLPVSAAFTEGRYIVDRDAVYVYAGASELSDNLGEITRGQYVTVTQVKQSYGYVFLASIGVNGWVDMNGLKAVTTAPTQDDIIGIEILPPVKTEYVHMEESLDLTGMTVYAIGNDNSKTPVTGYTVHADSFATTGEKAINVFYTPAGSSDVFAGSFTVKVIPQPITAVKIISAPAKTVYNEHEIFDITGLKVDIEYSDRETEHFTAEQIAENGDFTLSVAPGTRLEPGNHTLRISYKYPDIFTETQFTVTKRTLLYVTVKNQPDSLITYSKVNHPDISGLTLNAYYDNGEVDEVKAWECTTECDPSSFILGRGNPVKVVFGGKSVTLYYTLELNEIKGIYVVTPTVLTFHRGFDTDLKTLKVYYEYYDGTIVPTKDYTVSEINPKLIGTQNVIIKCGEYSDVFSIYISQYYGKGDINGSGIVDVTDARLCLRAAIGFIKVAGLTLDAADINMNGKADVGDARLILRQAIGLEHFEDGAKVILP